MSKISMCVNMEPVAQGRPRMTTINGMARAYDPKKSRDFKNQLALIAHSVIANDGMRVEMLTGALIMTVRIYREPPKSLSKKKKEAALSGELRPTTKPDLKNYIAGIEDALEGVCYGNDSYIVEYGPGTGKYYGTPRIEIEIAELEEPKE